VIVLIGFMGAGKTTVGRLVADKLGLPFTDTDEVIEERAGRPIPRIFAEDGEPAFRQLEHAIIAGLLAGPDAVLALGGGAAAHPLTRSALGPFPVVYLRVGLAEAMSRVGGDSGRPMLARTDVPALYAERQPFYASLATVTIDTDGRPPAEVALDVLAALDACAPR
jgi:shikimate kinase